MPTKNISVTEQLNKLIAFRQMMYDEVLTQAKEAQFETVDSLLLSDHPRSYAELSLSPVFRRQWSSLYAALERGDQDEARLGCLLTAQIPRTGVQVGYDDVGASQESDFARFGLWSQPDPGPQTALDRERASVLAAELESRSGQ